MKHSYLASCGCERCRREGARRERQGQKAAIVGGICRLIGRGRQRTVEDRRSEVLMRLWDAGRDDLSDWS